MIAAQITLTHRAKNGEINVVAVFMPESSRTSTSPTNAYGRYETTQSSIGRRQAEEPIIDALSPISFSNKQVQTSNSTGNTSMPLTGVLPLCHSSLDACVSATNNCSGHGACYKKYGNLKEEGDSKGSCFTCGCKPQKVYFKYDGGKKTGWTLEYWGGAACHKKDVSSAFWLITIFTVVMVGLVSWGIGLLYSIGEEQLPGVIGAGVSSKPR